METSSTQMSSNVALLLQVGQSIWLDNLSRTLIESGQLKDMLGRGVRGVTTNPAIFQKSIGESSTYDSAIQRLNHSGLSDEALTEELMIEDVQRAADVLMPLYESTRGGDGFVSLEVSPHLAHDASGTVAAGQRLWERVARPNVMIKVPGTEEGLEAIRELLVRGINVNVTLLFSNQRYREVAHCYLSAVKERLRKDSKAPPVFSVASFFVSRVDTLVEKLVQGQGKEVPVTLLGKVGIANCRVAYESFLQLFQGGGESPIRSDVEIQRPLWASTSVKNNLFSDTLYVSELMAKYTVNTLPSDTLEVVLDGQPLKGSSLPKSLSFEQAKETLNGLSAYGLSIDDIAAELEKDGVEKFKQAYSTLCQVVGQKRGAV